MTALGVLVVCSIALLALPLLLPTAPRQVTWLIYGTIVASGVARSFLQPARQALGQELIPRSLFTNAITWRSGAWQLAAVVGPAVGGVLYALGGTTVAYAGDVVLTVIGLVAISTVRHRSVIDLQHTNEVAESLGEGIRFVFKEPILLGALSLDLFSVFFGGATALLPVFAAEILHVGPQGLGALRAAPAVGAVVMSLVIVHRPPMEHAGRTLFLTIAAFGVFTIGFGLSKLFWLSLAMLVLAGAADMVSVSIRSNLLQTLTPRHLFGRVSSVNNVFVGSSNEIGMFESGVTAKLFGTVPSVVLGGVATLVVVGVTWARNRPSGSCVAFTRCGNCSRSPVQPMLEDGGFMSANTRSPSSTDSIDPAPPGKADPQHAMIVEMLEQSPWANELEHRLLALFGRYMRVMYADTDVRIFTEGDRDHFLAILVDGKIDILKEDSNGAKRVVVSLNRGKTFGELSLLDGGPRSSTAIAREDSTLLILDEEALTDLEATQPALAARILRVLARLLSQRLRMTSGRLVDHLH